MLSSICFNQVSAAWEEVQGLLADKHQQYSGVANMWAQYNDAKQGVMRVMEDVTPVVDQDMTFSSQGDVKKSLDQHKVCVSIKPYDRPSFA